MLKFTISVIKYLCHLEQILRTRSQYCYESTVDGNDSKMVVNTSLAATALVYLLLKSGDVEENPGPEQHSCEPLAYKSLHYYD